MDTNIIAVIIGAGLTVAGFAINQIYAKKSLVYAKHNDLSTKLESDKKELEIMLITRIDEIKDLISGGLTATNEKINAISTADKVCRANLNGITKERVQDLETHNEHNEEALKAMQETTTKLGKDMSSIQTGLNKLEKDIIRVETSMKALQETQNNMMALLNKIHGETAAKTKVLKGAINSKGKGVISKETYKG